MHINYSGVFHRKQWKQLFVLKLKKQPVPLKGFREENGDSLLSFVLGANQLKTFKKH